MWYQKLSQDQLINMHCECLGKKNGPSLNESCLIHISHSIWNLGDTRSNKGHGTCSTVSLKWVIKNCHDSLFGIGLRL